MVFLATLVADFLLTVSFLACKDSNSEGGVISCCWSPCNTTIINNKSLMLWKCAVEKTWWDHYYYYCITWYDLIMWYDLITWCDIITWYDLITWYDVIWPLWPQALINSRRGWSILTSSGDCFSCWRSSPSTRSQRLTTPSAVTSSSFTGCTAHTPALLHTGEHTLTHTHTHTSSPAHRLAHSHTHTHTHTSSPAHRLAHSHIHTHTHTSSPAHRLARTHTVTHTHQLFCTQVSTLTHSHTYTHAPAT